MVGQLEAEAVFVGVVDPLGYERDRHPRKGYGVFGGICNAAAVCTM